MSAGIACFAWLIATKLLALDVAVSATFCSRFDFILRMYANKTMNRISILLAHQHCGLLTYQANSPLLCHHEQTLYEDCLSDLRSNAFEQR